MFSQNVKWEQDWISRVAWELNGISKTLFTLKWKKKFKMVIYRKFIPFFFLLFETRERLACYMCFQNICSFTITQRWTNFESFKIFGKSLCFVIKSLELQQTRTDPISCIFKNGCLILTPAENCYALSQTTSMRKHDSSENVFFFSFCSIKIWPLNIYF